MGRFVVDPRVLDFFDDPFLTSFEENAQEPEGHHHISASGSRETWNEEDNCSFMAERVEEASWVNNGRGDSPTMSPNKTQGWIRTGRRKHDEEDY